MLWSGMAVKVSRGRALPCSVRCGKAAESGYGLARLGSSVPAWSDKTGFGEARFGAGAARQSRHGLAQSGSPGTTRHG